MREGGDAPGADKAVTEGDEPAGRRVGGAQGGQIFIFLRSAYYGCGSFGVKLAEVVPAEARVGHPLVVVVVDVLVLYDPRELSLLQVAARQQPDPLQLLHPRDQLPRTVDRVRVRLQRADHGALEVGELVLLLEEFCELLGVGLVDEAGLVPEPVGVGDDEVVAGAPADPGGTHLIGAFLRSLSCLWQESEAGTGF